MCRSISWEIANLTLTSPWRTEKHSISLYAVNIWDMNSYNEHSTFRTDAYSKKSPRTNSILSETPYISALCLAQANVIGLISIAMTARDQVYQLPTFITCQLRAHLSHSSLRIELHFRRLHKMRPRWSLVLSSRRYAVQLYYTISKLSALPFGAIMIFESIDTTDPVETYQAMASGVTLNHDSSFIHMPSSNFEKRNRLWPQYLRR